MVVHQKTTRPVERVEPSTPVRQWNRKLIAWVATAVVLAAMSAAYLISADETIHVRAPTSASETMSREDIVRNLVNQGLVPSQALDPATRSREDILRDLVNQGLIPAQSLETEQLSREDILRDLVNRGLIPHQSLNE